MLKGGGQLYLYVQVIGAFSGLNSLPTLPDLTYWHIGLNLETLKSPGHFKPDYLLIVLCGCEEDQRQKSEGASVCCEIMNLSGKTWMCLI